MGDLRQFKVKDSEFQTKPPQTAGPVEKLELARINTRRGAGRNIDPHKKGQVLPLNGGRTHLRKKRIGVESFHGGIIGIFQIDETHFLPAENGSGQLMIFSFERRKRQGDIGKIFFR